ncbi:SDR family NAD(P)-dependent oxidoreductase [Mangrovibacterium lignilyticum]|uniref:SDR family NAD(P)-dependent oxidoreductase n=1 Tax=Mangrovibacterium lignilyticum TaxID=2668052 RepID=UPI0013D6EE13|nr:SDR family NAD(P)-dependent oxidoreductase [Mangrovibacterium lignilyticum]
MKTTENEYALITGASKGLGRAIAYELAARKMNLLLVALPQEGLTDLCVEIRNEFRIEADCLEVDLTQADSIAIIDQWVGDRPVSILINNAGVGGSKSFESVDSNYLNTIIELNIRTVSLLTWRLLPRLRKQREAYILNVSSMASFSPIAYKTLYPASKAFVYNFSRCMSEELKDTGIFVSVLNPGPMQTNSDVCERVNRQSRVARFGLMSVRRVARIAVRDLFRRKKVIIPGISNQIYRFLMAVVPSPIRIPLISSFVKREISQLPGLACVGSYDRLTRKGG